MIFVFIFTIYFIVNKYKTITKESFIIYSIIYIINVNLMIGTANAVDLISDRDSLATNVAIFFSSVFHKYNF